MVRSREAPDKEDTSENMKAFRVFTSIACASFTVVASGKEPDRLFYDGVRAEGGGDLKTAISCYEEALAISHSANLHANLANLQFKMGNHGKAVLHFRKALLLDPKNSEIKGNLAFARKKAGLPSLVNTIDKSYFAPEHMDLWGCFTVFVFWSGLLAAILLSRAYFTNLSKISSTTVWLSLISFSLYATWRSEYNAKLLAREAVAVASEVPGDSNETLKVPLRRYAGEANANANLHPDAKTGVRAKGHTDSYADTEANGDTQTDTDGHASSVPGYQSGPLQRPTRDDGHCKRDGIPL